MIIFIENMKYKQISVVLPGPLSGACRQGRKSAGSRQAEIKQEAGSKQEAGRELQWLVNPCLVSGN